MEMNGDGGGGCMCGWDVVIDTGGFGEEEFATLETCGNVVKVAMTSDLGQAGCG